MTYKAIFTDEFLSYFRLDDNGKTLVLTDITGLTRAVRLEEVKHGEWTITKTRYGEDVTCPYCGTRPRRSEYGYYLRDNFCPNCGADMRGKIE